MDNLQTRIDAIREEFQDARPDVVMVLDELVEENKNIADLSLRYLQDTMNKYSVKKSYNFQGEECTGIVYTTNHEYWLDKPSKFNNGSNKTLSQILGIKPHWEIK